jgi:hypothetical protein
MAGRILIRLLRLVAGLVVLLFAFFIGASSVTSVYIWYDMLDDVKLRIARQEGKLEHLENELRWLAPSIGGALSEDDEYEARMLAWEIDELKDDISDDMVFRSIARRKLTERLAGLLLGLPIAATSGAYAVRVALG